jgi:hypothetical protein
MNFARTLARQLAGRAAGAATPVRLNTLYPAPGSTQPHKRRGRGPASGLGKTGGRGTKGQRARGVGKVARGFEGGQTPIHARLPKAGFSNARHKTQFATVSLAAIQRMIDAGRLQGLRAVFFWFLGFGGLVLFWGFFFLRIFRFFLEF